VVGSPLRVTLAIPAAEERMQHAIEAGRQLVSERASELRDLAPREPHGRAIAGLETAGPPVGRAFGLEVVGLGHDAHDAETLLERIAAEVADQALVMQFDRARRREQRLVAADRLDAVAPRRA